MLAKTHRLNGRAIKNVYRKGKTVSGKFILAKFFVKGETPFLKLAVVISKKNIPAATARNKIKRQITNFLAPKLGDIKNNLDLIITITKKPTDFQALCLDLEQVLANIL